jgi:hypothetical protein
MLLPVKSYFSLMILNCLLESNYTVAAVEISDRKNLNTLYKFRNLISVNRIFIKDYKVSVSIRHIRSQSRVTFEMPQLSNLQKCV